MPDQSVTIRGVILAGGKGTRLHPLTRSIGKNLLPVAREPMIYHSIGQLINAEIREILIVTNSHHLSNSVSELGYGEELGCQLNYEIQEEPLVVAHVLAVAENFALGEELQYC